MSKEQNELTPEILAELKQKHGELFKFEIPNSDETETTVLILRKLDRVTYSAGVKLLEKNELQAAELFLRALVVFGPVEEVIKDFEKLRVASGLLGTVVGVKPGNVTRL